MSPMVQQFSDKNITLYRVLDLNILSFLFFQILQLLVLAKHLFTVLH